MDKELGKKLDRIIELLEGQERRATGVIVGKEGTKFKGMRQQWEYAGVGPVPKDPEPPVR